MKYYSNGKLVVAIHDHSGQLGLDKLEALIMAAGFHEDALKKIVAAQVAVLHGGNTANSILSGDGSEVEKWHDATTFIICSSQPLSLPPTEIKGRQIFYFQRGISPQFHDWDYLCSLIINTGGIEQHDNKKLLIPDVYPEALAAVYLLMIAREKQIDAPLNSLTDEQWEMACEQYKAISEEKDANWSKASEWKNEDVEKVKKKIEASLPPVASQTR